MSSFSTLYIFSSRLNVYTTTIVIFEKNTLFKFTFQHFIYLERKYNTFIRWVLSGYKPYLTFIGTFALLIFAIVLLGIRSPKIDLFPKADPKYMNAFIELPLGKDISATDEITREVEKRIEEILEGKRHIVKSVLTQIGENTSDPNSPPEPGVTPNKARITVTFEASEDRQGISTKVIMDDARKVLRDIPGVSIFVDQDPSGPPSGKPLNIELRSDNIDSLIVFSKNLTNKINALGIEGIEELQSDVKLGKPELIINIDREAARRYELSTLALPIPSGLQYLARKSLN